MAKGVREGYSAVRAFGLSVEPFALRVLEVKQTSIFGFLTSARYPTATTSTSSPLAELFVGAGNLDLYSSLNWSLRHLKAAPALARR